MKCQKVLNLNWNALSWLPILSTVDNFIGHIFYTMCIKIALDNGYKIDTIGIF